MLLNLEFRRSKITGSSNPIKGGLKGLTNPSASRSNMCITLDTKVLGSVFSILIISMGPIDTKVSVWLSRCLRGGGRYFTSTCSREGLGISKID